MWRLRLRRWQAARRHTVAAPLQRYWAAPLPGPSQSARKIRFLVCDGEMTGLDAGRDALISLGWVRIDGAEQLLGSGEHHLIRVDSAVGYSATVHHLRDCDLARGRDLEAVLEAFLEAAAGCVVVFHHAALDTAFLDRAAQAVFGAPLLLPCVDTLWLEKRRFARQGRAVEPGGLRLQACRERYHLPAHIAHNALSDALATGELLLAQLAHRGGDPRLRELMPSP